MNQDFSEFDIIYKAIHHSHSILANNEHVKQSAFQELQAAQEEYLQALAHKTLIDKQYLQSIIE
ncbi:DUF3921 family protein [Bacillus sp. 165]|uniref:DUF3921 family protein n=1 Tax=Bacillus sp. 165 TaxID=1529117 RepID=UPI001AD9B9EB|nr:DUF3921 family protein [Bacillus sp. 165]MBO9128197.1 DUF3921 family protein [Bacillus sp. 165]